MAKLVLCGGCARHYRTREPGCPFCGALRAVALERPSVALAPGSSRSRRYASAVLLVNAGVFACGLTREGTSSEATASGGSSSVSASGGASSGGRAIIVPPTGGGAIVITPPATGGTGTERTCTGFEARSGCRTHGECPSPKPRRRGACLPSACPSEELVPRTSCPSEGCPEGTACQQSSDCGDMDCLPECDPAACAGDHECVSGACVPKNCGRKDGAACPDGYECIVAELAFCAPLACPDAYDCASFQVCEPSAESDAHGCSPKNCTTDADCGACGYCVEKVCAPELGLCDIGGEIALPYGCVWPDEELV